MTAVKMQATLRYAATPEVVSAMLVDPDFHQLIGQNIKATACSTTPGQDTITATYRIPTSEALRVLPGSEQTLTSQLTWTTPLRDGQRRGKLTLTVEHFPAKFSADLSLAGDGADTRVAYDGVFRVNIPLVGGALEKKAAGSAQQILDAGQEIGERWLADHGH